MSGSQFLGKGNQSKPGMPMYDSPAQKALVGDQNNLPEDLQAKIEASPATYASPAKDLTDSEKKKARYVALSKENENKPGFKEARNKAFGGTTTVKDGISTTKKSVKN